MKTFTIDERGEIPAKEFENFVDVDLIDTYTLEPLEDGSIMLRFFDKEGNLLPIKQQNSESYHEKA